MTKRIKMRSEALMKAFPGVYRDFFSQCELVVSTSRGFSLIGSYANIYGGLGLIQKTPLRTYVGLEPTSGQTIQIASLKTFEPLQQQFEDVNLDFFVSDRLSHFLNDDFFAMHHLSKDHGLNIHILTELPPDRGLNNTGSLCSGLAATLLLKYGLINNQEIKTWDKVSLNELITNKNLKFDTVFRLAWKLESEIYANLIVGLGPFAALIHSPLPVGFFTDRNVWQELPSEIPHGSIDQAKYYGFRLNELLKIKSLAAWPLDFGLIYGGEMQDASSVIHSTLETKDDLKQTAEFTKNIFKDKTDFLPAPLKIEENDGQSWKRLIEADHAIGLEIFRHLSSLLSKGFNREAVTQLFRSLKKEYYIQRILDLSTDNLNQIYYELNNLAHDLRLEFGFGAKVHGIGKRGDLLFVAAETKFLNGLNVLLDQLRTEGDREIWLDYASWLDGYGEQGVVVEQDLNGKIFSPFISRGSAVIQVLDEAGTLQKQIFSLEKLDQEKDKMDFLLDLVNQKIDIRGQSLNSRDLHSTKVALEILEKLIRNYNKEISAREFNPSSYIDRNEMQSKIVSPLLKITGEKLGQKLNLKISGGLAKNFTLKLAKSNFKIYLLEQRF